MSPSCCSGNFSSRSLGSSLRCPGSFCGSSRPSTLLPSRDLCSSSCYLWGPSLRRGCQVTSWEPSSCRPSCCSPSPCQTPLHGALGWGSRCPYSLSSGFRGLRPLGYGVRGVPVLSPGSRFCRPSYRTSRSCQSSCYRPACGSDCY
ncbi:keratin-associated protein 13-1-like [Desmodus rotundus]|uniref:keratin-associated protein 13-1-like n=1 Tax=Desmodus rotundus TaxID=9430 RepID=UPI0023811F43|nr:keratin-associated protein 13-1-like [Desmodus rotundus]